MFIENEETQKSKYLRKKKFKKIYKQFVNYACLWYLLHENKYVGTRILKNTL